MSGWKTISANLTTFGTNFGSSISSVGTNVSSTVGSTLAGVDLSGTSGKVTKSFANITQSARERLGTADDITELPEDYKLLERRVDALRNAHLALLKITKVYETQTYDYPVAINESAGEITQNIGHQLTTWAAAATRGTNLPTPAVTDKAVEIKKTLPHALSRAAAAGAIDLGASAGDKLGQALQSYAVAQDKIGDARLLQDDQISHYFINPWAVTLNQSIQAAMRSRQAVKSARLTLDSCRTTLKNTSASGPKQEQARLEVEAAEEKLVLSTEEAISLMRSVLENPESIAALGKLVQAQQEYSAHSAQILSTLQTQIEGLVKTVR